MEVGQEAAAASTQTQIRTPSHDPTTPPPPRASGIILTRRAHHGVEAHVSTVHTPHHPRRTAGEARTHHARRRATPAHHHHHRATGWACRWVWPHCPNLLKHHVVVAHVGFMLVAVIMLPPHCRAVVREECVTVVCAKEGADGTVSARDGASSSSTFPLPHHPPTQPRLPAPLTTIVPRHRGLLAISSRPPAGEFGPHQKHSVCVACCFASVLRCLCCRHRCCRCCPLAALPRVARSCDTHPFKTTQQATAAQQEGAEEADALPDHKTKALEQK